MKLKQALIIGLSSAILAIPAIAAESATDLNNLPAANTNQPAAVTPAKQEAVHHRKGHKKISLEKKIDPKQEKGNTKLDELNTLNSDNTAGTDQTEKDSVKS
ncbi:hypothetical protein [Rickettsiella endosymbiont of Xylota segnis]|uniref:hypothetical protein n=1 Tax=Rickettsiella endosymbiont of Xylota segnis TaxID=3066238 RepID=UPI0030CED149